MFHLKAVAERLPLRSIFQNMTFIHYVQRLANVTKIAKFILPSIYVVLSRFIGNLLRLLQFIISKKSAEISSLILFVSELLVCTVVSSANKSQ